jgi:hypothetical protein
MLAGYTGATDMVTLYEVLKQAETEGVAVGHFNVSRR